MTIVKIIFAACVCVPLAVICYFFLTKLVEQLLKK